MIAIAITLALINSIAMMIIGWSLIECDYQNRVELYIDNLDAMEWECD